MYLAERDVDKSEPSSRRHGGIGTVDLIIAATAELLGAELITTNVRHFPMFGRLRPPYWT